MMTMLGNAMNGAELVLCTDRHGRRVDPAEALRPLNYYTAMHSSDTGRVAITVDPTYQTFAYPWWIHHGESTDAEPLHAVVSDAVVGPGQPMPFRPQGQRHRHWAPGQVDHHAVCRMTMVPQPSATLRQDGAAVAAHTVAFTQCRMRLDGGALHVHPMDLSTVHQFGGDWRCEVVVDGFDGNVAHYLGFEGAQVGRPFGLAGLFWVGHDNVAGYAVVTPASDQFLNHLDHRFLHATGAAGEQFLRITSDQRSGAATGLLFDPASSDLFAPEATLDSMRRGLADLRVVHTAFGANGTLVGGTDQFVPTPGARPTVATTVVADRKLDVSRGHRVVYLEVSVNGRTLASNVLAFPDNQNSDERRYFARVQMPSNSDQVEFQTSSGMVGTGTFMRKVNVKELRFRLFDANHRPVELEGVDYSMLFEVYTPQRP
jgi:hypothetical protein